MNNLTNRKLSEKAAAPEGLSEPYMAAVRAVANINTNAFKVKNILAVVKPSESSAGVLKYAAWLASQFDCEITLFHAVPNGCTALSPRELQDEFARVTGQESVQIRAILVRPATSGFSPILEAACDEHADLVVLPADFYKEPLHFWQTNLMEKLIHHLRCPLLIVGEKSFSPDSN
jgi:nucleotide-binding universal stress UspA family protein